MPHFASLGACVHGGKVFGEPRDATSCICQAKARVLWMLCKSCAFTTLCCLNSIYIVPQTYICIILIRQQRLQLVKDFFSRFSPVWW